MSWRSLLLISTIIARFYFAVQPSYLHPDEFYQSFQILYNKDIPWEVSDVNNINRSICPILLFYYPIIKIGNLVNLNNYQIYLLIRLFLTLVNWLVTDYFINRIIPLKNERIKSLLFISTSYITLIYQSHTFSNSIETIVLLPTLYLINDIRQFLELKKTSNYSKINLVSLGLLVSFGIFNRITFPAWILLPCYYLLKFSLNHFKLSLLIIVSFLISSICFISIDKIYYNIPSWYNSITPLNNLVYNSNVSNLSNHGLHKLYTHVLINYPQLIGPLIFLLPPFNNKYVSTIFYQSFISGILVLSLLPHQELRFLLPSIPLLLSSFSFNKNSKISKYILKIWLLFNTILIIFYGLFHQAGLIPAINYLNSSEYLKGTKIYWFNTYPPPTFLINSNFENVNLMGFSIDSVVSEIELNSKPSIIVTPSNSIDRLKFNSKSIEIQWHTLWHLDLDHFDFDNEKFNTFLPGLDIYKIL